MFTKILGNFPSSIRLAFAYGSGVFQQQGHAAMGNNMLDFIFVVDNSTAWHQENLAANGYHYSYLKFLGHKNISHIQRDYGAQVYFNTLVKCEGRSIKYGVIDTSDFLCDLLDWKTLYIAGRLHKPVNIIHKEPSMKLSNALHSNLQSAVHASLLLLPERFTEQQLYETITGLSYSGDFRMKVGEDQNKVRNIVIPNMQHFHDLYEPILNGEREHLHWQRGDGCFEQNVEQTCREHHLNLLPSNVLTHLVCKPQAGNADAEYVRNNISKDMIQNSITEIVKKSSWTQSVKGSFTAGPLKTIVYSSSKVRKMLKSRFKSN